MPGRPPLSLEQHLRDTEQAAAAIFDPATRLHRNWLRFFRIPASEGERFLLHVRVAGLLHDLGKANEDFYRAVTGGDSSQLIRHEHLSALLLFEPTLRAWLGGAISLDLDVVAGAVLSHHLKASDNPQHDYSWCKARGGAPKVTLFLDHPEVIRILERIAQVLNLSEAPPFAQKCWAATSPWSDWWQAGMVASRQFRRSIRVDHARRALLLATKAGVIAADAVASALVREGRALDWVNESIHREALSADDIARDILDPRAEQVAARSGKPFAYHRFQDLASEQDPRALLLAACGAGKTLAAWRWAAAQASKREFGRVVFLYPTRGTATEGFRDYVGWAPEGDAALVHGSSRYELESIFENPSEALSGKDPRVSESDARLFALGLWSRRYFSATVDQFLSFIEHQYKSVCLLPLLADSAVVIDEVHSFDRRMLNDLVAFLKEFDVPVLCMTATLGKGRRQELVDVGLSPFPRDEHRAELADLDEQERHPRYRIEVIDEGVDALVARACAAFRAGLRVLWVVNTVRRCQAFAVRLSDELGRVPIVYHSRFRLCDRRSKHGGVVKAFQLMQRAIAVTTQVCEMSLDLDADVLITEVAPVSSLVQRFGRANRHRARGNDFRAAIYVYAPESPLPYERDDLARADEFLHSFAGDTSQRALAEGLERFAANEPSADGSARFLESGYFAVPGPFRDAEDTGGPCVLDLDLDEVMRRLDQRKPWDDLVVPVPKKFHLPEKPSRLPRHINVASGEFYDANLGFLVS